VKLRSLVLVAAAASLILVIPAAHAVSRPLAHPLTTEPDVYDIVDVTITDSKIVLSDRSSQRGNGVDFKVRNAGKKVHSFALVANSAQLISLDAAGLHTPLLKPGATSVLSVYMDTRGVFLYRSLAKKDRAKPGMHGKYTVT
jgi:hypothetical protein